MVVRTLSQRLVRFIADVIAPEQVIAPMVLLAEVHHRIL
jgi:hypothetical protein